MTDTTQILIPGDDTYMLVSDFSDFTTQLHIFASVCHAKKEITKAAYLSAFEALKDSFSSLVETKNISAWVIEPVTVLFSLISSTLAVKKITDVELDEAYQLSMDFLVDEILSESPNTFKHRFLENAISNSARRFYSDELFNTISNQLESSSYDDAVLVAFKYLDKQLRKLAGIDSYEYFGEELINKVFAPNSGVLKVNTHPNEQVGLRNWFSGANAIFRNPIAHRFANLDDQSAFSVIAMVALMDKIATNLSKKTGNSA